MKDATLPVELLEAIIHCLESEYNAREEVLASSSSIKFLPQWYLLPLFRVCKLWYNVAVGFLYRRISVGATIRLVRRQEYFRRDIEVARKLLATLTANDRLAALVEELQMGIYDGYTLDWTQENIRILQICPNVEHVEIRNFDVMEADTLAAVLKEKSLVSLRFRSRFIVWNGKFMFTFYELIRQWPKLQAIDFDGIGTDTIWGNPCGLNGSDAPYSTPQLQEVILRGNIDNYNIVSLLPLRNMTGCVTRLCLSSLAMKDDRRALEALCECMRTWSQTLECLRLFFLEDSLSYSPFWKVFSTLERLQELQFGGIPLDFGLLANLPRLERLQLTDLTNSLEEQADVIASYLQDVEKFSSLKVFVVYAGVTIEIPEQLKPICLERGIQLVKWDDRLMTSLFLL